MFDKGMKTVKMQNFESKGNIRKNRKSGEYIQSQMQLRCYLKSKSNSLFMHGHHAIYVDTSTHPLFLEAKSQSILWIIEEFGATRLSFSKFAL